MVSSRFLVISLGCSIFFGSTFARAQPVDFLPQVVNVKPTNIFLPTGFDGNDNAQIIVAGEFPTTCYKAGKLVASVDPIGKKITLRQEALLYSGCWCGQILVPYSQSVDLGLLPVGDYSVQGEGVEAGKKLAIAAATTSAPDEHFYAPVEEVSIDVSGADPILTLRGTFASDCMKMQEVKVVHREKNVIEVLPITTLREGDECKVSSQSFTERVPLPMAGPGKTLIHIRSLNGQAINRILSR